ncbi:hypothetical protein HN51_060075 [Arachis hypogaea]
MSAPSLKESYVLSDPNYPCIIDSNGMSNQGNAFMENQHQLPNQALLNCKTLNNHVSSASYPTTQTEKKKCRQQYHVSVNQLRPWYSHSRSPAVDLPETSHIHPSPKQCSGNSMVIPLRFSESAFPSRHNHVNVILDNGSCYRMGLRWSKKRKVQLYLTRGWKTFAKYNGFRAGTVLEFSVLPSDETTLHVKILKI